MTVTADETTASGEESQRAEALSERLFGSLLGALEVFAVFLGWRLGLYEVLASGAMTVGELADRAGIHPRYAREWLEQQAVAGLLAVDDASAPADVRRYSVPPGHGEVLVEPESLLHFPPLASSVAGIGRALPEVVEAYRSGGGVPYERYGQEFRDGQAGGNRPAFAALMGEWLAAIPSVDARLRSEEPARVADLGCGQGWSSIAIARAYPHVRVLGIDVDRASVTEARALLQGTGVEDRVRFEVADAESLEAGGYDLACVFEALHDMARPVEVLQAARVALADGGALVVMDERVAEAFTAPGDEAERLFYAWSVSHCLPASMAEQPSAALGTVLRAATVRSLTEEAGFGSVEVLPIENDLWRFYLLRP